MEIKKERLEQAVVYHLEGDMDLYTSSEVRERIGESLEEGIQDIVLHCRDLAYIDSSGIGVLISLFTTLKKRNGALYLCALQTSVYSVISFTKLTGFLSIYETLGDVLKELEKEQENAGKGQDEAVHKGILQNDAHELLVTDGMFHKDFNLDLRKVRRLSQLIVQKAPPAIREINLLEQQICEIIKNAVRHGNKNDPNKKVNIWFSFSERHAHLIVQDEGEGFRNITHWNDFYAKKMKAFEEKDFETMMDYLSYRTTESNENDGGNALFAAVEFWNRGVVFSERGNTVAVKRIYNS